MAIADGCRIPIRFTQPLVGNVLGLNPPLGYKNGKIDMTKASVSALNEYNTSYPASKVIDGNTSTYWYGTTAINWLQISLPMAKTVTRTRLYLGEYYIKTFTFSGSNDGGTWTQIGGVYTAANTSTPQWYTFDIPNAEAYLFYRIDTLTAYSSSAIFVYELELYEEVPTGNETKFTISFDEYNMVPGGSLSRVTRPSTRIEKYVSVDVIVVTSSGSYSGITDDSGVLMLAMDEGG